jgi:hypothetical protein
LPDARLTGKKVLNGVTDRAAGRKDLDDFVEAIASERS